MDLPAIYSELSFSERKQIRNRYLELQKGMCCHCGAPLNGPADPSVFEYKIDDTLFPEKFFNYPIHLHHDHNTGLTIGTVHCLCNAVLWQYFDE